MPERESVSGICLFAANWLEVFWKDDTLADPTTPDEVAVILVRSENWKAIVVTRGLDPDSPAFTFYPKRETFIEEALVTQVPVRNDLRVAQVKIGKPIKALPTLKRRELVHA
jgi:hypothetical protein